MAKAVLLKLCNEATTMPKHKLTQEDMFVPKSCAICGNLVWNEHDETCCWECEQQWQIFIEDLEDYWYEDNFLYEDF